MINTWLKNEFNKCPIEINDARNNAEIAWAIGKLSSLNGLTEKQGRAIMHKMFKNYKIFKGL